jgi:xylan 1,4-beta-xylosidase
VHQEIAHSARPTIPLIWSEFNASYGNQQDITDSIYMGPWMADTISRCDGMTEMMSYWTFSDVFEEQGVVKTPFYGGFGLLAERGIPKPSFEVFELLHELGDQRLQEDAKDVLVTRRKDGTVAVAAWNLVEPSTTGSAKTIHMEVKGMATGARVNIRRVDAAHGDTLDAWKKMGSPAYPTKAQVEQLRKIAEPGSGEPANLRAGRLDVEIPAMGLALIEIH